MMIDEIVQEWISEMMKNYGITKVEDLTDDIINLEIKDAKDNIENLKLFGDKLGIACSEEYIEWLKDHLKG